MNDMIYSIGVAVIIIPLIGVIWKGFNKNMDKLEDKTVLRENCIIRHEVIEKRLDGGDEKFDAINVKLELQNNILIRIDERVGLLIKKNDIKIK